jgi:hypothetical protein
VLFIGTRFSNLVAVDKPEGWEDGGSPSPSQRLGSAKVKGCACVCFKCVCLSLQDLL